MNNFLLPKFFLLKSNKNRVSLEDKKARVSKHCQILVNINYLIVPTLRKCELEFGSFLIPLLLKGPSIHTRFTVREIEQSLLIAMRSLDTLEDIFAF